MHWTFRSILNEMLLSLRNNEWLRRDRANGTLRYLFDLMAEDHPTLRRMGFDTMLRTINRELSNSPAPEAIPVPIAETLHGMSIVAACMQETSKHYNIVSNINDEYARLANDATSAWQECERPWVLLVQGLLERVQNRGEEVNAAARNEAAPLEQRHRHLWNIVDDCMRLWSGSDPVVRMILDHAPVPIASAPQQASTMVDAKWNPQDADSTPTATQKKKSKASRKKSKKKKIKGRKLVQGFTFWGVRLIYWNRAAASAFCAYYRRKRCRILEPHER